MKSNIPLRTTLLILFSVVALTTVLLGLLMYQLLQPQTFADSRQTYVSVSWLMVGVLAFITAVGIFIVLKVTQQLHRLREEAVRFANGDLSRQIEVSSQDEIGQLSTSFNQMAERLRDSYQRLSLEKQRDETLLESMGEGMIAVDKNGAVVLINSNAREMLELGSKEVTGKAVQEVFTINTLGVETKPVPADERPELRALHHSQAYTEVFGFQKKESKPIQMSVNANPVIANGETAGAVVILRDVTHEREVDRMKTEFISLASHQLRTPLSAIKWFTEMLLSGDAGKLSAEQKDFVKNIYDSSQRMVELVGSLLNISRIESGRIIIDPKPTDLNELVSGIVNDLKAKSAQREQHLAISVHKELPKINLDPRLIGQVYLNLLTNAIKYSPKGGEITVLISRKGHDIVSQVSDNGYGIPKAEQKKVFQKFFRAENAVKVETDGTGLGLYLIKAIIESSGGKIWFESVEGKGTTFWFSLPVSGMKAKAGEVTLDT